MDAISTQYEGPLAIVTMDDGKANAMDAAFLGALHDAFDGIEASEARAVILRGRPGFFSAGLNVKRLPNLDLEGRVTLVRALSRTLLRVFAFPRPVLAAISGHALAGGALLALAADTRIAAEGQGTFGVTEVAIGVDIPSFGIEILRESVPVEHLAEIALAGATLTPSEAHARSLYASVVASEQLDDVAQEHARQMAKAHPEAYAATKARLRSSAVERAERQLEAELDDFIFRLGKTVDV